MISDGDLYRLAMFLGCCAMMMIVLYHFLEVNAQDDGHNGQPPVAKAAKSGAPSGSGESNGAHGPAVPGAAAAGGSPGSGVKVDKW
ncbi:hypothetical protein AWENTII_007450 [Aspergillus wentii]